jgi:prolyl-tRNA editing enzyme YbaK/EbsC (Cys-tRNA(Pro) deacylase)
MAEEFDDFELGAVRPFGPVLHALELVDQCPLDRERIMCSGGDHEHGVLPDPQAWCGPGRPGWPTSVRTKALGPR